MADKPCSVPDCPRVEQLRKGFCKAHYYRMRTYGDPLKIVNAPTALSRYGKVLFHGWSEVDRGYPTLCWEYNGSRTGEGYGFVTERGRKHVATRVVWEHVTNDDITGLLIRHKCDNPPCVNPDHLEPGTVKDNAADALSRGRFRDRRGEKNGSSILSESEVLGALRGLREGRRQKDLANELGVSPATISSIASGKRWRHVLDKFNGIS